jgi:hypothetical protein
VIEGKPSPWIYVQEKAIRTLTALSMRLRLSPQSRIDPKAVARRDPRMTVNPWEWERNENTGTKGN